MKVSESGSEFKAGVVSLLFFARSPLLSPVTVTTNKGFDAAVRIGNLFGCKITYIIIIIIISFIFKFFQKVSTAIF